MEKRGERSRWALHACRSRVSGIASGTDALQPPPVYLAVPPRSVLAGCSGFDRWFGERLTLPARRGSSCAPITAENRFCSASPGPSKAARANFGPCA